MEIILSTRNPSKVEQIQAVFKESPIKVFSLNDFNITGEALEDGSTLTENSLKKATFALHHAPAGVWTMADDTGLYIHALNNLPGVNSARWAGDKATTDEITAFTLKQLEGKNDRSATFETVVAILSPKGETHFFIGKVNGNILETPRTKPQPKMPYSSIFVPNGQEKVWAEMTIDEENAISHRGKAFHLAKIFLETR